MGRCSDARERLVGTAVRLFHERGYTAVSVAEICDAAGLKKGSFYHFFPSKLELVLEALDHYGQFYQRVVDEGLTPGKPARVQLEGMFAALRCNLEQRYECEGKARGCPIGNLALELADREEPIRHKIEIIFAKLRNAFEGVIRRGVEKGELAVDDPRGAAEALMAMVQGAMVLTKTANDPQVFARLVEVTLDGIAPRSHPNLAPTSSSTAPMTA
ncbi:MAG TPA: TetR/AcrR family transcriptional regulator [Nannocystaceae bacterium]|nr:TetR/AcrR family transcriptional regulator [Nannocystaceae bacterium]